MTPIGEDLQCPPVAPAGPQRHEEPVWSPVIAHLSIEGICCRHCATRIRNALVSAPAVLGANVSTDTHVVDVLFDAARLHLDGLAALIASAGDGSPRHYVVTDSDVS